jgi:LysR family transcriptional regulator of beta-lactamase
MFARLLATGEIVQPFEVSIALGSYWLTRLQSRQPSSVMQSFANWLLGQAKSTMV